MAPGVASTTASQSTSSTLSCSASIDPELVVHAVPPRLELVVGEQQDQRDVGQLVDDGLHAGPIRGRVDGVVVAEQHDDRVVHVAPALLEDAQALRRRPAPHRVDGRRPAQRYELLADGVVVGGPGRLDDRVAQHEDAVVADARAGCRRHRPAGRSTPARRARRPRPRPRDRCAPGPPPSASTSAVGSRCRGHRCRTRRDGRRRGRQLADRHRAVGGRRARATGDQHRGAEREEAHATPRTSRQSTPRPRAGQVTHSCDEVACSPFRQSASARTAKNTRVPAETSRRRAGFDRDVEGVQGGDQR